MPCSTSSCQIREPISISYRISGKPTQKKPIVLLGNNISIDFSPSGHARNEHSLNRWGFKITIRGIYGKEVSSQLLVQIAITETIAGLTGNDEARLNHEKAILKWQILKNGLIEKKESKFVFQGFEKQVKDLTRYQQLKRELLGYIYNANRQGESFPEEQDLLRSVVECNKVVGQYVEQIMKQQGEFWELGQDILK